MSGRSRTVALIILTFLTAAALFGPALAPHSPFDIHPERRLSPPTVEFLLGTDHLGRCLLSRLLWGARLSLGTTLAATAAVIVLGAAIGLTSGYFGGKTDLVLMSGTDVVLAFPSLLLALAVAAALGPGLLSITVAVIAVWWAPYARVIRGMTLSIRQRPFVEAAKVAGASHLRIIAMHILPGLMPSIMVLFAMEMGSLMLALSGLNFLGLGVEPSVPEWGAMIFEGRLTFERSPGGVLYPGLLITLAVVALNLLADSKR
jgi:peptide/nickel transport system permease protein